MNTWVHLTHGIVKWTHERINLILIKLILIKIKINLILILD